MICHNICRVDFDAVFVRIRSGLDMAGDSNLCAFPEILLCKFTVPAKRYAGNEICRITISVFAASAVDGQRVFRDYGFAVLTDVWISCETSHKIY